VTASFPVANPTSYSVCGVATDRSSWNKKLAHFFDYWLSIKPAGGLPGRQHFDPLDIPHLMPRVWMLDVLREPLRYRYRLAGTKEVGTLEREVTGRMFDEVHPHLRHDPEAIGRFNEIVQSGIATYRKGAVLILHQEDHRIVENCIVPLARDGKTVDILIACSILYDRHGQEN
jgi:hypothetical protein